MRLQCCLSAQHPNDSSGSSVILKINTRVKAESYDRSWSQSQCTEPEQCFGLNTHARRIHIRTFVSTRLRRAAKGLVLMLQPVNVSSKLHLMNESCYRRLRRASHCVCM